MLTDPRPLATRFLEGVFTHVIDKRYEAEQIITGYGETTPQPLKKKSKTRGEQQPPVRPGQMNRRIELPTHFV
ncbi:MAG TPA: hypothetical protein VK709_12240 [Candidatus Saccharimonadales bacterium]|nr:hypothetical protein [Candidatus Saccharimonadales bacterium]